MGVGETTRISGFKSSSHDHWRCIEQALNAAARICADHHARFTPIRRLVLELVWREHKPVPAYDLLEQVQSRRGRRTAPPTVYRALDFLQSMHLIHRIESLNAYVGCPDPDNIHQGQFLICQRCRGIAELNDDEVGALINERAAQSGFQVVSQTVEILGTCPVCRGQTRPAA